MPLPPTTPDLAALDLFISVVELGSLSKAAAAHQIAQPSASSRIRNLERRLGLALLERSPGGSAPTQAGALVAEWAEGIIRATNQLTAGVEALKSKTTGHLRLAASLTIAEYLLPPWLGQLLDHQEGNTVELEVTNSALVVELLEQGKADIGFVESPTVTPNMTEQVVGADRLVTVVGSAHEWARHTSVTIEQLVETPLILRERGSGTRTALEDALAGLGFEAPQSGMELGSTAAVRAAVALGQCPAVLSELAIAADLASGRLVEVEVVGLSIHRRLRAIWPTSGNLPPQAITLLERLPSLS